MSYAAKEAQRSGSQHYPRGDRQDGQHHRQSFHHPRTSLGASGHWVHLLAIAAPLIIPEVIKDPEHRWRALRWASVGAALASEAVWTHRLSKDRKKDEATSEALAACAERGM